MTLSDESDSGEAVLGFESEQLTLYVLYGYAERDHLQDCGRDTEYSGAGQRYFWIFLVEYSHRVGD